MIFHSEKECILRTPHRMMETTDPDARSVHQGDPATKKRTYVFPGCRGLLI